MDVWKRYFGGEIKKGSCFGSMPKPDKIDPKSIVDSAKQKSDVFSKGKQSVQGLSQSAQLLTGNFSSIENSPGNMAEIILENHSYEDLLNIAYDYKEKYDSAVSRATLLEGELSAKKFRVEELETKLADATSKLKDSCNAQANFMAAGDKLAAEKKLLIEDISHDIAESLKPKIKLEVEACNAEFRKKIDKQFEDINGKTDRVAKNVSRAHSEIETVVGLVQTVVAAVTNAGEDENSYEDSSSLDTALGGAMESSDNASHMALSSKNNNNTSVQMTPYPPRSPPNQVSGVAQMTPQGNHNFHPQINPSFNRKLHRKFKHANKIVNKWNKLHGGQQLSNFGPQSGFHLPPLPNNLPPSPQHSHQSTPRMPFKPYGQHSGDPNFTDPRMNAPGNAYSGSQGYQWN